MSKISTLSKLVGGLLASTFLATPAISQELTGTLKKIKDSGTITVGHRETSVPLLAPGHVARSCSIPGNADNAPKTPELHIRTRNNGTHGDEAFTQST